MHLQVSGNGNLTSKITRTESGKTYITVATNYKSRDGKYENSAFISASIKKGMLTPEQEEKLVPGALVKVKGFLQTYIKDGITQTIVNLTEFDFISIEKKQEAAVEA